MEAAIADFLKCLKFRESKGYRDLDAVLLETVPPTRFVKGGPDLSFCYRCALWKQSVSESFYENMIAYTAVMAFLYMFSNFEQSKR